MDADDVKLYSNVVTDTLHVMFDLQDKLDKLAESANDITSYFLL